MQTLLTLSEGGIWLQTVLWGTSDTEGKMCFIFPSRPPVHCNASSAATTGRRQSTPRRALREESLGRGQIV